MLLKFFMTCNKIGAFTLGGGYAMIPIMEREFVDKNQWMDRQEFMDIMVVAQTTPGIFAVALIAAPCFKMAKTAGITWRTVWIPIVCCLLIALANVSPIYLIIIAGVAGWLLGRCTKWN